MRNETTSEQRACYQNNGYAIIEDFLTPKELQYWIEVLDEAILNRKDRILPGGTTLVKQLSESENNYDAAFYQKVFLQRVNLWQDNPKVKELMFDPAIGKLATDLTGNEGFRMWHDQALYKAPWSNATAWHTDNPYWSFSSKDATSIWVALDDVTPQNGCMYFLPGSHKVCNFDPVPLGFQMDAIFESYPQLRDVEPVIASMKAGSCSFHNGLTVHGAGPNMTPRWRRAMTVAMMPIGATFNGRQNILTDEQMARLNAGDVMEDDVQNPVLWERGVVAA